MAASAVGTTQGSSRNLVTPGYVRIILSFFYYVVQQEVYNDVVFFVTVLHCSNSGVR